jgi:membrane protease YdiL (CAAX protease family)
MAGLIALIFWPLAVIGAQLALDLDSRFGVAGYALYKVFMIVPPLVYCRRHGIRVWRDIVQPANWRRGLPVALGLGLLAIVIFWGIYFSLGDLLIDKEKIAAKIEGQFMLSFATLYVVAPFTIFINSFMEEFFYRGFCFGELVKKQRSLGYLLPALAFTGQHLLFMYHWMSPLPLAMAVVGLFVLALVLQRLYETSRSLVAPWVVHMGGDVAMMGIAFTLLTL